MMAKKLKSAGGSMRIDSTARSAKASRQSNMVAKMPGGDPVAPTPSPTTTQPMVKVVPKSTGVTKKVAKVEKAKRSGKTGKKLNKPGIRKTVK